MIATHELTIRAACPVDNGPDLYLMTVRVAHALPVEEILAAVAEMREEKLFQEDLTERLARRLNAQVRTVGVHSGVKTTVVAGLSPEW